MTPPSLTSLRFKLGAVALFIQLMTVSILTWQGVSIIGRHMENEYMAAIESIVPTLKSALIMPVLEEDTRTLRQILTPLTGSDKSNISAITIIDSAGELLLAINELAVNPEQPSVSTFPEFNHTQFLKQVREIDPLAPIQIRTNLQLGSETIGYLTLQLDTQRLTSTIATVTLNGVVIGLLAMVLGSLVFVIIAEKMSANLRKLQLAADAIGAGDYQQSLVVSGHDELAALATAFNLMTQKIRDDRQQLLEREQHMLFTLNSMADGVIAVDMEGVVRQINPVACGLLGCPSSRAIGQPIGQIFHLIDSQSNPVALPITQALKSGNRINLANEIRLLGQGQVIYPIQATASPITNEQQQIVGAIMVFHDISEEYQHQLALTQQHELLNAAETVAKMGSWSRDLLTDNLYWSPGMYQLMQIDPQQSPSYALLSFLLPISARKQIARALEQQTTASLTCQITLENGERKQLQINIHHFFDQHQQPQRVVGIVRDITEQHATIHARLRMEQILLSVINSARALVVVKDRDGYILHSNKTHADVFTMTAEEMVGKTSHDFHPPTEADEIVARDQKVLQSGTPFEITETLFNGVELRVYTSTRTPLVDDSGEIYGLVFFAWDVTEQTRRHDMDSGRQKMAALGQLTGGVAHDYNNMLAIILGFAELLSLQLADNPKANGYVEQILRAGQRSAEMTKKLLGFARLGADKTTNTDLSELLSSNLDTLRQSLGGTIKLSFHCEPELWPVVLNTAEFEDALINLAVNARQAMPAGGAFTININNQHLDNNQPQTTQLQPGDYVAVSLADSGVGMDKETLKRILEPFFTTKGDEGTGLGLSQVYGFVQRARGDIQITSALGTGSEFTLYFPRAADPGTDEVDQPSPRVESSISAPPTGKILLVDDEPALVEMSTELLAAQGHQVTAVGDGETALQLLSGELGNDSVNQGFDLLITDIIMPNMDGQRLAQLARELQPGIRVLFVSGYNQAAAIKLQPGHTELLTKPFSSNELLTKTRQILAATPCDKLLT